MKHKDKIKAVFFDIDGTLLPFGKKEIPPSTLKSLALLREQGILLFIATGRHPSVLKPLREVFPFDGYVTMNGQYVIVPDALLRAVPMETESVHHLLDAVDKQALSCVFMEIGKVYSNFNNEKTNLYFEIQDLPVPGVESMERTRNGEVFQVLCFASKEEEAELKKTVTGCQFVRWSPLFVDIVPKNGGKEKGIASIGAYFDIAPEEMLAFGDMENDVGMLEYVGTAVAMGNGTQAVFDVADYVTTGVEEDGIYQALVHYQFIQPDQQAEE